MINEFTEMDMNQLIEQLREQNRTGKKPDKESDVETVQWRAQMFQEEVLICDHAQNDFGKVFRFTVTALTELHNKNVTNYRIHIQDREGNLYFFAIGPDTPVTQYKKATRT